jgi:hypothetical protein
MSNLGGGPRRSSYTRKAAGMPERHCHKRLVANPAISAHAGFPSFGMPMKLPARPERHLPVRRREVGSQVLLLLADLPPVRVPARADPGSARKAVATSHGAVAKASEKQS